MKKMKYIIGLGVLMLLTTFASVSCTDGNDWEVDSSTDRLFSVTPSSFTIAPEATTAEFKWTNTPGTEYYIVEVSKDTLYNDMPNTVNSIVLGEDKTIVKSPYILTNLDSDNKYFIRIKAVSSAKPDSKWTYPEKFSFKTKSEQIMNPVTNADKTSSSARLTWKAEETVTKIELLKGDVVVETKTLTASEITAGEVTFTNLDGGTPYQANLYNNSVRRGYALFTTFPNAPSADVILYLTATDVIDQAYLDALAVEHPGKSITLVMASEATYLVEEKLTIPDNMSITFFGLAGTNRTILNIKGSIDYAGNHGYITFQNLNIDCLGKGYVMNQSDAANVGVIKFDGCLIQNVATSFFRIQGTAVKTVNSLIISDCLFRNIGSGYYFIHIDTGTTSKAVVKNLTLSNSTFFNICATGGKGFIYSRVTDMESLTISNCTMYKIAGAANYFIDFGSASYGATNFSIDNTILSMTGGDKVKGIRAKITPSITNTYATKDWFQDASAVTYSTYNGTAADLFTDPDNGDFTFKDGSMSSSVGDPRWIR